MQKLRQPSQGKITERAPNQFSLGQFLDAWKTCIYLSRQAPIGLDKLAVCKDTSPSNQSKSGRLASPLRNDGSI